MSSLQKIAVLLGLAEELVDCLLHHQKNHFAVSRNFNPSKSKNQIFTLKRRILNQIKFPFTPAKPAEISTPFCGTTTCPTMLVSTWHALFISDNFDSTSSTSGNDPISK